MNDPWMFLAPAKRRSGPCDVMRYGLAVALVLCAALLTLSRPGLADSPQIRERLDSRKKAVALQLPARSLSGGKLLLEMTLGAFSKRGRHLFTAIIRNITKQERMEHVRL